MNCQISASCPFPNFTLADYARQALAPDGEVKPLEVERVFTVKDCHLQIDLHCVSARMARVSLQAVLDNLELIVRTMQELEDV